MKKVDYHRVIKASILTEKSASFFKKKGVYTLRVEASADKTTIKNILERSCGVEVASIRTAVYKGEVLQKRRRHKRHAFVQNKPSSKKVFVTLKSGSLPDAFGVLAQTYASQVEQEKILQELDSKRQSLNDSQL